MFIYPHYAGVLNLLLMIRTIELFKAFKVLKKRDNQRK